jgi:hypothetical protein
MAAHSYCSITTYVFHTRGWTYRLALKQANKRCTTTAISLLSRTSSAILKHLASLPRPPHESAVLYTISSNAGDDISSLNTHLSSLTSHTIGCISSPQLGTDQLVSCSIATFAPRSFLTFRSNIFGREKSQVERWRMPQSEGVHAQRRRAVVEFAMNRAPKEWPADGRSWDDLWRLGDGLGESSWTSQQHSCE